MILMPLESYVDLEEENNLPAATSYCRIRSYNDFLKLKPLRQMFVPCDLDGNKLEKPEGYDAWSESQLHLKADGWEECFELQCRQYQTASRWLYFTGFDESMVEFYIQHTCLRAIVNLDTFELTPVAKSKFE